MNGEMQSCMQFLRVPIVKLQRAEAIYPAILKEGVVSTMCRGSNFIVLFPGFMWQKK